MTLKQFEKKLIKLLEEEFVVYNNKDKDFSHMDDGDLAVCGEDENATFGIHIVKVEL